MTPQISVFKKRLAYAAFFLVTFLLVFGRTFPVEAVQERLVLAAAAKGWQLEAEEVGPSGLLGIRADRVKLEIREGVSLAFDDVRASLRIGALLMGRQGVSFRARFLDGTVVGVAERNWSKTWTHVAGEVSSVDLARSDAIRKMAGLDLGGKVSASVDVELDNKEPTKSAGEIEVTIDQALVKGGEVPIPGMTGGFSLPKIALGKLSAKATIKDGKATVEKLEAKGQDLEARGEGITVTIQPRLEHAPIFGKILVRPSDAFWSGSGTAGFRGLAEAALAQAKGGDGFYGFQLHGTLGHPQAQQATAKPQP
jgi:type II secretion system protein N